MGFLHYALWSSPTRQVSREQKKTKRQRNEKIEAENAEENTEGNLDLDTRGDQLCWDQTC